MKTCVILGAGGHARETYWHARACGAYTSFVFVDDFSETTELNLDSKVFPVEKYWSFDSYMTDVTAIGFVAGVGDPRLREHLVGKAYAAGLQPWPSIIHPDALIQDPSCRIGNGGLIGPRCTLTTNVTIGDFVLLNVGVSVAHDSVLEDYVTCAPRVALAGNVTLRKGVSLGIGSVVRENVTVQSYVRSGAQSCLVKDVTEEGITVVGVPAYPIQPRSQEQ